MASPRNDAARLFSDDEAKDSMDSGNEEVKDKEMKDLFGSDYDSEEEEFKASGIKESPVRQSSRPISHDPSVPSSSRPIDIYMPKTPKHSKETKCFITKMPNILRLIPDAYTESSIQIEMNNPSDETLYRNYVRWRYARDQDGNILKDPNTQNLIRESNAKVVQWEDGTLTLFVGKEALYLSRQKIGNSFLFVNELAYSNAEALEQANETVLECHGRLQEKLTIRPMTTSSTSHKSLTMSMRAKHNKGMQKVKEYVSELDGLREQEQRAKINEDKIKLQHRKKAKAGFEYDQNRAARMDASFLEEGYDEEDENVHSIKDQYGKSGKNKKSSNRRRNSFSGDGLDEYRRAEGMRNQANSQSEEEMSEDGRNEEDDEGEDEMPVHQTKKLRSVEEEDSD